VKSLIKLITINLITFFLLIILIELFFGYWFDKNNFGPYMREHRLKKILYKVNYNQKNYEYTYLRNYNAFRGQDINPEHIKIIMIGGSTTDERYKPEKFTIVEQINQKLEKNNYKDKIINAGIEGQSTFGHLANFKYWFNKIEGLKPKFIIFYIGINDAIFFKNTKVDELTDGWIENPNSIERFVDNIKSRSIFYDLIRKTKYKYYINKSKIVIYDLDYIQKRKKNKNKYINYEEKLKIYNYENLKIMNTELIEKFKSNIDNLYKLTKNFGAEPIFINQSAQQGDWSEKLFILNNLLIFHCTKKGYYCIDLNKNLIGKDSYWWDGIHTTPEGSKEISNIIFPELFKILKK